MPLHAFTGPGVLQRRHGLAQRRILGAISAHDLQQLAVIPVKTCRRDQRPGRLPPAMQRRGQPDVP